MQHMNYDPEVSGCSYHRPLRLEGVVDVGHGGTLLSLAAKSCVPSHLVVDGHAAGATATAVEVVFSKQIVS